MLLRLIQLFFQIFTVGLYKPKAVKQNKNHMPTKNGGSWSDLD